jgi:hypothetical protein
MPNFAPLKNPLRTIDSALQWLKDRGFAVSEVRSGVYRVTSNQCVAEIEATKEGTTRVVTFPSCLIAGEPAELVDRGYQKFFTTSKLEVAATAELLEALHQFSEQLKEALGYTSLYNEGLGTVSGSYQYDRVRDRDLAEDKRPPRPWQK